MLGLSGNQQGAWPQRSHSSPALLPGPAVSFCVKRKKQIDFFFILHKPRDESDVRMKINASFTPNNVQKETCIHAQYIMGTFSWQGNLYARIEHHPISKKHWIIHARTRCVFTAEQTPRSKFPFEASERPLFHNDLRAFFAVRKPVVRLYNPKKEEPFCSLAVKTEWSLTVNERKPWSFVKEHLDDSICPSSDYKLIQLARQETALTPMFPDFPEWKHLFGRFFTQASLPLKHSGLVGLGAKVKRVLYKTFWFSTNSTFSLSEKQVQRSEWKPQPMFTAVTL